MGSTREVWQRWLSEHRGDFIGGDIAHVEEPEGHYRGPITSIEVEDRAVVFLTEWTGHVLVDPHGRPIGNWKKSVAPDPNRFTYAFGDEALTLVTAPRDIGDGRFCFQYPFSLITLFPRDGESKLERSRVEGL